VFYEPIKQDHGLPKNPFNSLVIPRPIGWITTVDLEGVVNLAPYSFFNAVGYRPPTVMFAQVPEAERTGKKIPEECGGDRRIYLQSLHMGNPRGDEPEFGFCRPGGG